MIVKGFIRSFDGNPTAQHLVGSPIVLLNRNGAVETAWIEGNNPIKFECT